MPVMGFPEIGNSLVPLRIGFQLFPKNSRRVGNVTLIGSTEFQIVPSDRPQIPLVFDPETDPV